MNLLTDLLFFCGNRTSWSKQPLPVFHSEKNSWMNELLKLWIFINAFKRVPGGFVVKFMSAVWRQKLVPAQSIVLENLVNFNTHTACLGLYRRFMIGFQWLVCSSSSSQYTRMSLCQTSVSVDILLRYSCRLPKKDYQSSCPSIGLAYEPIPCCSNCQIWLVTWYSTWLSHLSNNRIFFSERG